MNGTFSEIQRIAIIIDTLNGGGAEKVCLTLANAIEDRGVETHLFVIKKHCDYIVPENLSIHFLFDNARIKLYSRREQKKAARALEAAVGRVGYFDAFFSNLTACHAVVAQTHLHNVFYIIHNSIENEINRTISLGPLRYWRELRALKHLNSKHLIGVSHGVTNEIRQAKRIKPHSITTIYNPVDIDLIKKMALRDEAKIPTEPYIIFVGRIAKQKRIDILLEAFKHVKSDVSLVFLGNNSKKLLTKIRKSKNTRKILNFDFSQNPYTWIRNAKALVLSSDYEGFGMVLVEALACNTPVASTACPYGPDEILNGKLAAFLAPIGSPVELAEKIDMAIEQTEAFIDAPILEKVSAEKISEQYLRLVEQSCIY